MKKVRFGSAFSIGLRIFESAHCGLDFLADVFGHERHFVNDLLFVMKTAERGL